MIELFTPRSISKPTIYAYKILRAEDRKGLLKVGFTVRDAKTRIHEQLATSGLQYEIVLEKSAMRGDGSSFSDHDVHKVLKKNKIINTDGEWFKCSVDDVKLAIDVVRDGKLAERGRINDFQMRPEQKDAVEKTANYFRNYKAIENKNPHFLWNAKMRFGKTFAAYQLALELNWKKVLILTFKPAVQSAWEEDLETHKDFKGWQFISNNGLNFEDADESKPIVCFGSFQNYLGRNPHTGGIKTKNEWVHLTDWDCVIFDEYHYGSWREKAKDLFESDGKETSMQLGDIKEFDEDILPIPTKNYLYLSGTPFRAMESGEFIEEQIFNWTYSDEQRAKEEWDSKNGINPYLSLPRMIMMTYQVPDDIREIAISTEFNEFDLNVFFQAEGKFSNAKFTYKDEVQKQNQNLQK